jgi:hypothetical protein
MEVSVRPITVTEELAAVGRTRARRCRAALIERDTDGDDRAGHGIVTLTRWRAMHGMYSVRLWISTHMSNRIEEGFDVDVEHPVVAPAALARRAHGHRSPDPDGILSRLFLRRSPPPRSSSQWFKACA